MAAGVATSAGLGSAGLETAGDGEGLATAGTTLAAGGVDGFAGSAGLISTTGLFGCGEVDCGVDDDVDDVVEDADGDGGAERGTTAAAAALAAATAAAAAADAPAIPAIIPPDDDGTARAVDVSAFGLSATGKAADF